MLPPATAGCSQSGALACTRSGRQGHTGGPRAATGLHFHILHPKVGPWLNHKPRVTLRLSLKSASAREYLMWGPVLAHCFF